MTTVIDLNCDMGEFEALTDAELDLSIMPHISRCNIAVGGHAGNRETIKYCFEQASQHGLKVGIHPSYADRDNFGRKVLSESWQKTKDDLIQQIDLGLAIAEQTSTALSHLKLHGALYNHVEADAELATNVAVLFKQYSELSVLGMANGNLQAACASLEIPFIREAFIDRRYVNESQLQPRSEHGAVFSDEKDIVQQALAIATNKPIRSANDEALSISADSLCIHSDTPNAMQFILTIEKQFEEHGIVTK